MLGGDHWREGEPPTGGLLVMRIIVGVVGPPDVAGKPTVGRLDEEPSRMGIENSSARGTEDSEQDTRRVPGPDRKRRPAKGRGNGVIPVSTDLDDLLRSSSVLASIERTLESVNTVNAYLDSTRQLLEHSSAPTEVERMLADYSTAFDSISGTAAWAASLRWLDQVTPPESYVDQLAVTARMAERIAGSGALTSWRSALEVNSRIEAQIREMTPSPILSELDRISRVQVDLTDWAVQHVPGEGLLGAASGLSVLGWRDLVSGSVDQLDELPMMVATGRTNLALLGSDLLDSPDTEHEVITEGVDRVESEVIEPWMTARLEVTAELYGVLARIDAKVPELLNGAWDDVRRRGPAAAEKAASCTVEAVERALRAAAPDDAVRVWHTENKRSAREWEGQERPPHSLRVRYLARNLGGPRSLVEGQGDAFASIVGRLRSQLQATKHASRSDLIAVRVLLCTAENLLITLLVEQGSGVQSETTTG
jgi:hypothetical protein